jgi:hypothetical protein
VQQTCGTISIKTTAGAAAERERRRRKRTKREKQGEDEKFFLQKFANPSPANSFHCQQPDNHSHG